MLPQLDKEFCQTIEKNTWKISHYADEIRTIIKNMENRKANFLKEIVEKESQIHQRTQELKDMIELDTKLILEELSYNNIKSLKVIEI